MTGLAKKLGLKTGTTVWLREAPDSLAGMLAAETEGLTLLTAPVAGIDGVLAFVRSRAEVAAIAPVVLAALKPDGLAWFAYPKKTGAIESDLSRDSGWEPVHAAGFDSVAQVSIDETWTGYRFRAGHLIGKRAG